MRFCGIDPSTKTGIVILNSFGQVVSQHEIAYLDRTDPERMMLISETVGRIAGGEDNRVCIEGFAHGAQGSAVGTQYGIGWGIRIDLFRRRTKYIEVAPAQLKKFCGAKGTAAKDELAVHIFKRWGFEHKSDNVRDAYVLAQIAWMLWWSALPIGTANRIAVDRGEDIVLASFQHEVLSALRNPVPKKKSKTKGA